MSYFELLKRDGYARLGRVNTAHGVIETPAFMPVGTQGSVKAMSPAELEAEDYRVILGNTYHLNIRPGLDVIRAVGGLHRFMGWKRAILTDSGGFQVFSLAKLRKLSDEGAAFQSHVDGAPLFLGPREALEIQAVLGSDIAMLFDECPPWPATHEQVSEAVRRTLLWAQRQRDILDSAQRPESCNPGQKHFAIVQGGSFADLRENCARELVKMEYDGYAIGGVSVGEPEKEMYHAIESAEPFLPEHKPRYAMGLGHPHQMVEMVARGIDMFDCVLPTRLARNGTAYVTDGQINLENARYTLDPLPIEPGCACYACQTFSRAYIRHMIKVREIIGVRMISLHNLHFFAETMRRTRAAIVEGRFQEFRREFVPRFAAGLPASAVTAPTVTGD